MKKMTLVLAGAVFAVAAPLFAATPTVTAVTAQQRYPWNGLVDIVVTISGEEGDVAEATCVFAATNSATRTALAISHVTQVGTDSGSGNVWTRHFIWDTNADVGEVVIIDVELVVNIPVDDTGLGCVQLWENGPYWAECNVGATKPEEYGLYFWWGDKVGHAKAGKWFSPDVCPTYYKPVSELRSLGYIDSEGNLTAEHDAATAHLGSPWRMPTKDDIYALGDNCDTKWTTRNGVQGRLITGKGAFASNSIFLPAAGYGTNSSLSNRGYSGYYWSSSVEDMGQAEFSWDLCFTSSMISWRNVYYNNRGLSVRPIRESAVSNDARISIAASTHLTLDNRTGVRVAGVLEQIRFSPAWETESAGAIAKVSTNGVVVASGSEAGSFLWSPTRNGIYEFTHAVFVDGEQVGETLSATFLVTGKAPTISIDKADVKSIDLSWDEVGLGEGTKYAIFRGTNTDFNAKSCIAVGLTDLNYSDTQWSLAYDHAPMLTYWVLAQKDALNFWSEVVAVETPKAPVRVCFQTGQGTSDMHFADWCAWGCECDNEWHYNDEKVWLVPGTHHIVFHDVKEGEDEHSVKRNWPAIFQPPTDTTITVNIDKLPSDGIFEHLVRPNNCHGRVRFLAVGLNEPNWNQSAEEYAACSLDDSKCSVKILNNSTGEYIELPMNRSYFLSDGVYAVTGLYDGSSSGGTWFYTGDAITIDTAKLFDGDESLTDRDIKLAYVKADKATSSFRCKFDVNANDAVVDVLYMTVLNGTTFYRAFPKPRRNGYFFMGWYTKKEGGINADFFTPVNPVDLSSLDRDEENDKMAFVFYAQWREDTNIRSEYRNGMKYIYEDCDDGVILLRIETEEIYSELQIPEEINGCPVRKIGRTAISEIESPTEIVIPDSILEVEENAFKCCTGLQVVKFSGALPVGTVDSGILDNAPEVYYPRKYASQYEAVVPAELFAGYSDEEEVLPNGSYSETIGGYTWYYDVKDGEATIARTNWWGGYEQAVLPSPTGDIDIPASLGGCPVIGIGASAFCYCYNLRGSVSIPDSVATLGGSAFRGTITNLSIGASLQTFSPWAFRSARVSGIELSPDNTNLALRDGVLYSGDLSELLLVGKDVTTLTIPAEMESDIHAWAFQCCPFIETIVVEDGNTRYEVRNGMLYDTYNDSVVCAPRRSGAVTCYVPDGTRIVRAYAAEGADYQAVEFPEGLVAIEDDAFCGCDELPDIAIPESVEYIGAEAFYGTGWWNEQVGAAEESSATTPIVCDGWLLGYWYGDDFDGALVVPDGVKALADYAFENSDLTEVVLPIGVDVINEYAFDCCDSLTAIRFNGDKPTHLGMSYWGGEGEQYWDFLTWTDSEAVCYVRKESEGWTDDDGNLPEYWPLDPDDSEYTDDARQLRYWTTPDGSYSETIDGYTWYYEIADGEATIVAPDEWNWSEVDGDLIIPETLGGCPVVRIGDYACYSSYLRGGSVVVPDSVEIIFENAFSGIVTNLSIGASVNAISENAFLSARVQHIALDPDNGCFELQGDALYADDRSELLLVASEATELQLPAEMTSDIPSWMFTYCSTLALIAVETGNTRYETRNGLLYDTDNDSVVCAPRIQGTCSVPDGTKVIRSDSFAHCGYQSVLLPDDLLAIEYCAFYYCTNLSAVTLPEKLEYVGSGAFWNTRMQNGLTVKAEENAMTAPIVHDGWLLGWYYGDDFNGRLVIPEGVRGIADYAINNYGVTEVMLPDSVDMINGSALSCYTLKEIRFKGDAPTKIGAYCQDGELSYSYNLLSGTDPDAICYVRTNAEGWADDDGNLLEYWPLDPDDPENTDNARKLCYWKTSVPQMTIARNAEGGDCRLTLTCETEGATIRYTMDGSEPIASSPVYSDMIAIGSDTTIKAYATSDDFPDSDVATWVVPAQADLPLYWPTATNDQESPWFEACSPFAGTMQSGHLNNYGTSTFEIATNGALEISFSWMASSEQDYDWLVFYVDDEEVASISGDYDWEEFDWTVGSGEHVVRWSYEKDGSDSDGDDCGRLKDVVITVTEPYDPIPDLGDEPTEDEVYEALEGSADAHLAECITNAANYIAYREWAATVKKSDGTATAGAQEVRDAPNAWMSFALGSDKLLEQPPTDNDLTVERFEPSSESGKFDFTVSVDGIEVGSEAQKENLKQVFGLEGATTLNPDDFSSGNVDLTFGTPADGKVKFTAGPKNTSTSTFFMKVKVNP